MDGSVGDGYWSLLLGTALISPQEVWDCLNYFLLAVLVDDVVAAPVFFYPLPFLLDLSFTVVDVVLVSIGSPLSSGI